MAKKALLSIGAGTTSCIHNDGLIPLLTELGGSCTMERASRIEPDPEYQKEHKLDYTPWYVDLSLSGGPPYTPGFTTREQAIGFEEKWITENVFHKTGDPSQNINILDFKSILDPKSPNA